MSDPAALAVIATSGGASVVVDLKTRRVPNVLTFGTMAAGLILAATHGTLVTVPAAFAGFALGLLLMMPGHLLGGTGAGDVKLFAGVGTLLGPTGILVAFVYTLITGGLLAVLVAIRRRRLGVTVERTASLVTTAGSNVAEIEHASADNRFAYAPAIAVGALAAALGF
jgi:prepilin peptidase CpaA